MNLLLLLPATSLFAGCASSGETPIPSGFSVHTQVATAVYPLHELIQSFDGDFTLTLEISPGLAGPNAFSASLYDNLDHKPVFQAKVTLYATMQDMPMGTDSVVLSPLGDGQYNATGDVLSMAGDWALGITIQTGDKVTHKAGVRFSLAPAG